MASLNFEKSQINPRKSTRAILLSSVVYISVFYVFNLSPTALQCTTKFWFVMSNTLVLVIATDFGAFSKTKPDELCMENNIVRPTSTVTVDSLSLQMDQSEDETMPTQVHEEPREKIIDTVEEALEIREHDRVLMAKKEDDIHQQENPDELGLEKINKNKKDKETAEDEDKMALQTTLSEGRHERDEDDEFSSMSNEELTKRVEEFIQRFNGQIRLQATQNLYI